MSHAAFLSTIRTTPDDDTARLVYADFLDEQGSPADAARGEFIRVQIELARLSETDPKRLALEDRENELLRAHEAAWLGALPRSITGWTFERGFLTELSGEPAAFELDAVRDAFDRHPITRLRINGLQQFDACKPLIGSSWLGRVRELELSNVSLSDSAAGKLLATPGLTNLTALKLTRVSEAVQLGRVLSACPALPNLKRFELAHWSGDGKSLAKALERSGVEDLRFASAVVDLGTLLSGKLADRLTRLEVESLTAEQWTDLTHKRSKPALTHLGIRALAPGSLADLLAAPACARVVALDLNESRVPVETVQELSRAPFWKRCCEFKIIRGKCPPETMRVLTARRPAPQLRVLKLGETGLRDAGVRHLCEAPWADTLTELDVMRNYLTDEACETIRDSGRLANVRRLDLRTNGPKLAPNTRMSERITDVGLEALSNAPGLARLRQLNGHSLPIGTRGAVALLSSPHFRLAELDIGGTDVTAETIRELARCPNLARLTRLSLSFVNGLADNDLIPLAESEHLSPLCEVGAIYYRFSERCRSAMRARLGRRFTS